jgi:hypothetical protein
MTATPLTASNPIVTGGTVFDRFAQRLLLVNGALLGTIAFVSAFLDLMGYFRDIGPMGPFHEQPVMVGMFEAHCLAAILCLLVVLNRRDETPRWNIVMGAMHLLFGSANLTFWPFFIETGTVPFGIAITTLHFAFFGLEAIAAVGRAALSPARTS